MPVTKGIETMDSPKRTSRADRGDVAVILLDNPERTMNVIDEILIEELGAHVESIESDLSFVAAVLGSAKDGSFGAGADIQWLPILAARPDVDEYLARLHALMYQIVNSKKPYVAAVNGAALGGALEVALATEAIVAVPSAQLGLPESSLGLIPGGAGTQLIRRFVSTQQGLDLMLSAKPLAAAEALEAGLVAQISHPASLLDAAVDLARALAETGKRRGASVDSDDDARATLQRARDHGPGQAGEAGRSIIDATAAGIEMGLDSGCASERTGFIKALRSSDSRALCHLFVAEGDIKRRGRSSGAAIKVLGVVGAGQMGSGIAATAVSRRLEVRLRDISDEKLVDAHTYLEKVMSRGGDDKARKTATSRLRTTTGWDGFADCDAVIEAVFELPELKLATLSTVCDTVSPTALVATNTSAIPIHSLASAVTHPERFLGTHFFSPVDRMPFVEIVPHVGTSPETVSRAARLAGQLGKTHIVVADRPGFFTSRVYARWLIEGIQLLLEGASVSDVDSSAVATGFPVGPLQALDEVTLDLVMKASIIQVAQPVMAKRLDVSAMRDALQQLMDKGVLGRRYGHGFYVYEGGKRTGPNTEISEILGVSASSARLDEVRERLVLAFASESFLCWDDGTLCHPDDGDVASVRAIGFPRRLGGPFHWADEVGATSVLSLCKAYVDGRFASGETLEILARSGGTFHDQVRRASPGAPSASKGVS
jgi:3-hydroxyacyl-CoA dehydrogenase / enoyl-CoA hydratase / 3-hydroxybutyryl-CoA epimerase